MKEATTRSNILREPFNMVIIVIESNNHSSVEGFMMHDVGTKIEVIYSNTL